MNADNVSANKSDLPMPVVQKHYFGRDSFSCPWTGWNKPLLKDIVTWLACTENLTGLPSKEELDKTLPVQKPLFEPPPDEGIRVTWLGHATVLVQLEGINILTDPIFSQRASLSFDVPLRSEAFSVPAGSTLRFRPSPCTIDELGPIDVVLISHNHFDHLDYESVKQLNKRFGKKLCWLVPLGLKDWMANVGCENVYEMNWWDSRALPNASSITARFTPAQHWCGRGLSDTNKVLWGSWCILGSKHRFYFAGDTGYCDVFKKIGQECGPFDLAAIPIGAYHPRWFMRPQHVDPKEAVKIHEDVKAKRSIGIHWGTFPLANEHYLAPKEELEKEVADRLGNEQKDAFFTLQHGESKLINDDDAL